MPAPHPSAPGPLRFAHPFFTDIPPEQRPPSPRFGRRMLDHIENRVEPVPKPKGDSVMLLSDIIGKHGRARAVEGEGLTSDQKRALCDSRPR